MAAAAGNARTRTCPVMGMGTTSVCWAGWSMALTLPAGAGGPHGPEEGNNEDGTGLPGCEDRDTIKGVAMTGGARMRTALWALVYLVVAGWQVALGHVGFVTVFTGLLLLGLFLMRLGNKPDRGRR